jgi:hypothetical protein
MSDHNENAEWLKAEIELAGNSPIVLANSALPIPHPERIKEMISPHLPAGWTADVPILVTSSQAITAAKVLLKPEHRKNFIEGIPVLLAPVPIPFREKFQQGRREVMEQEQKARDGLHVNIALCIERIRACENGQEHRSRGPGAHRPEIFETLAPLLALGRFDGTANPHKKALAFVKNGFREGQGLLRTWFDTSATAREIMKLAYDKALKAGQDDPALFKPVVERQKDRLTTLSAIHLRTQDYVLALPEVPDADTVAEPITHAAQQSLAYALEGGPGLYELMDAAIYGDINPAPLFANWATLDTDFVIGQVLGRLSRGSISHVDWAPFQIERLERMALIAIEHLDAVEPEKKTAKMVWRLALSICEAGKWEKLFAAARGAQST